MLTSGILDGINSVLIKKRSGVDQSQISPENADVRMM
jgi:hypothetical protein